MPTLHAMRESDVMDSAECLVRFQRLRNESVTFLDIKGCAVIIVNPKHKQDFENFIDTLPGDRPES